MVIHILTTNISKMFTDRANIATAIKYDVACGLSISIFKVDLGLF